MQQRFCFFALRGQHISLIRVDEATYDEMLPQCSASLHISNDGLVYVLWPQHDPADPPPIVAYDELDALLGRYWQGFRVMPELSLFEFARIADRLVAQGVAYARPA